MLLKGSDIKRASRRTVLLNKVTLSSANTFKILYEFIKCFGILQANTIHANNVGDINIETGLGYYANIHLLRSSSIRGAVRSDMII